MYCASDSRSAKSSGGSSLDSPSVSSRPEQNAAAAAARGCMLRCHASASSSVASDSGASPCRSHDTRRLCMLEPCRAVTGQV